MLFNNWLKARDHDTISAHLLSAIEDAILLGGAEELDAVLAHIEDDEDFPAEIRYALESLRYFRAYYGPGCELEPTEPLQKQKATVMEIAWGAELLDMLKNEGKIVGFQRA